MKTKTKWTNDQSNAIYSDGGATLVSAAAGSGKTAVLVERVIQIITNTQKQVSADKLLIATFSNAAASEMRQRIEKQLDNLISNHPENSYYRHQKILLNNANISTVHSFCLSLVREHFHRLDIAPDFRIGDESEIQLIRNQAAEDVIEIFYGNENPAFYDLVELISSGRDDKRIVQTLLTLYEFIGSHPFPDEWLKDKLDMYNADIPPEQSLWGNILLNFAEESLNYGISICHDALNIIREFEDMTKAYYAAFVELESMLQYLISIVSEKKWNSIVKTLQNFQNPKLGRLSGDSPEKNKVKAIKEYIQKKILAYLRDEVFIASSQEYKDDILLLKDKIEVLFSLVKEFMISFKENKKERNLVDFSDLEHMTLKLLLTKNDDGSYSRSQLAEEIADNYHSVLVDEYQDTNEVQDLIFKCVSKNESNLFMVGDVKQSIYAFRQAMPEIFINRRKKSVPYDGKNFPASIILGKNFRSRIGICNGINTIFKKIMSSSVGGIDYNHDEHLVPGADYPIETNDNPNTNVIILDVSSKDESSQILEAREIGRRISSMVDDEFLVFDKDTKLMRPCTYRDFSILVRSKRHTETYEKEISSFGIPIWSDFSKSFFASKEILYLISFLSIIDNPLSDINICSAMMSPMFNFTPDEMSDLSMNKKSSLYISVLNSSLDGNKKCAYFIDTLNTLRTYATTSSVSDTILKIFELTSFDLKVRVMASGEQRLANLNMMVKQAEDYESSGYRGLSGFIRFMKKLMDEKLDIPRNMTLPGEENVVKIMTIHRSKGLEFPICFLADCTKKFNLHDLYENTLLHSELGFSCKYRNPNTLLQYPTIPHEALKLELKRNSLSEEMRILYVALTRAKEHLFMMCSINNPAKKIETMLNNTQQELNPFFVRSGNSYCDWILMAVMDLPDSAELRKSLDLPTIHYKKENLINIEYVIPEQNHEIKSSEDIGFCAEIDDVFLNDLKIRCEYQYPNIEQTLKPTKLAVSDLAAKMSSSHENIILKRPKFLYKSGLSPAEIGNAHHIFMQFADYKRSKENPTKEVERMVFMGYLTEEEGKAIKIPLLTNFFNSQLANRIFNSSKVFRELKFIIGIDGNKDENQTMVQGVADCVFFEDNEFIIVDYKTDYVTDSEILIKRYRPQLEIYRDALEQSFSAKAKQLIIYSFSLNKEIIL